MNRLQVVLRKLRRIAASDLAPIDKLRYVLGGAGRASNPIAHRLRGGISLELRPGTTDSKVFDEIFIEQAYAPCVALLPANLGPVTLIDLGANIGLSALFLTHALDVVEIIAVEPDPDNFRQLVQNLRGCGLADRCTAIRAFAGAGHAFAELHDSGNGAWGMRMGPLSDAGTPVLPVAQIAGAAKTSVPIVLKCDIEGGERQLFLNIRDWEHLIPYIFLELHTEFLPVEELFGCLESSGFQWTVHGTAPAGEAIALLLLERGARRKEKGDRQLCPLPR